MRQNQRLEIKLMQPRCRSKCKTKIKVRGLANQVNGMANQKRPDSRIESAYVGKYTCLGYAPYIVKSARPPAWKKDKTVRNEMRQKIQSNIRFFMAIKKITDTNILDGITEESVKQSSQKQRMINIIKAITLNCLVNPSRLRMLHLG